MDDIIYEDVNPTLIENATVQKLLRNGEHQAYYITPNAGYVLHDSTHDYEDEYGNPFLGYRTDTASCGANYDFAVNPREFYTVPETDYRSELRELGVEA